MPISVAKRSTARSITMLASGRPAPRTGPVGVALVSTALPEHSTRPMA